MDSFLGRLNLDPDVNRLLSKPTLRALGVEGGYRCSRCVRPFQAKTPATNSWLLVTMFWSPTNTIVAVFRPKRNVQTRESFVNRKCRSCDTLRTVRAALPRMAVRVRAQQCTFRPFRPWRCPLGLNLKYGPASETGLVMIGSLFAARALTVTGSGSGRAPPGPAGPGRARSPYVRRCLPARRRRARGSRAGPPGLWPSQ